MNHRRELLSLVLPGAVALVGCRRSRTASTAPPPAVPLQPGEVVTLALAPGDASGPRLRIDYRLHAARLGTLLLVAFGERPGEERLAYVAAIDTARPSGGGVEGGVEAGQVVVAPRALLGSEARHLFVFAQSGPVRSQVMVI
jgi:hypothetical protein